MSRVKQSMPSSVTQHAKKMLTLSVLHVRRSCEELTMRGITPGAQLKKREKFGRRGAGLLMRRVT